MDHGANRMQTRSPALATSSSRVWLIGGTQESKHLAHIIAQHHIPCTITVTTETARSLYPVNDALKVRVGSLQLDQIASFLAQESICAILDASHPFAVEMSQRAIAASQQYQLPYLRYERRALKGTGEWRLGNGMIHHVDSLDSLLSGNLLQQEQVLLTIGARPLPRFQSWQSRATLHARVLPTLEAMNTALNAGFSPDRLIALRPPISAKLEKALWQQWQITTVVTKASGLPGGEDIKRQLAAELGVKLIVISRPQIAYPQQTDILTRALEFCQQYCAIAIS